MTKKTKVDVSTNLHDIFATNSSLEESGAWVTVNDLLGLRIKIRRMNSEESNKAYAKIVKEFFDEKSLRKPDNLTTKESGEILKRQLAEAVLVDWEGVRDTSTNKIIPYSKEAALALMDVKDFREFVYEAATTRDAFRDAADEDAEKNF